MRRRKKRKRKGKKRRGDDGLNKSDATYLVAIRPHNF